MTNSLSVHVFRSDKNLSKRSVLELTSIRILPSSLKIIADLLRDSMILAMQQGVFLLRGYFFDQHIAAWNES